MERIDWKNGKAFASQMDVDYYTEALSTSEVKVLEVIKSGNLAFPLYYGSVKVNETYHSYKIKTYDEVLDIKPIDLPPLEFETKALWFEIPEHIVDYILDEELDLPGGIHALEHATIALSPMYAMCDRWDIGGTSYSIYPDDKKTKIFIYDGFPGGIGISEQLYEKFSDLLSGVLKLITECQCQNGCPSCIQSPKCGNDNFPLDKKMAILLLQKILNLKNH
ncbi:MAG: Zn-binding domain-containing protein [Candidatus Hodarchaeales archaeon]